MKKILIIAFAFITYFVNAQQIASSTGEFIQFDGFTKIVFIGNGDPTTIRQDGRVYRANEFALETRRLVNQSGSTIGVQGSSEFRFRGSDGQFIRAEFIRIPYISLAASNIANNSVFNRVGSSAISIGASSQNPTLQDALDEINSIFENSFFNFGLTNTSETEVIEILGEFLFVDLSISTIPNQCSNVSSLNLENFITAGASLPGLSITGDGVINNSFRPSFVGVGEYIITARTPVVNGTDIVRQRIIRVTETYDDQSATLGEMWLEDELNFCADDPSIDLRNLIRFSDNQERFTFIGESSPGSISFNPGVFSNTTAIRYTYTNDNQCTTTHDIPVNIDNAFQVTIANETNGGNQTCIDQTLALEVTPTGGIWSNVDGGISEDGNSFIAQDAGVGRHTLVYNVEQGACSRESAFDVDVFSLPPVEAGGNLEFCNNVDNVQTLLRGNTFPQTGGSWSFVQSSFNSQIDQGNQTVNISTLTNGTFPMTLQFTNENGCFASSSFDLIINDVLNAPITSTSFICEQGRVPLQIAQPQNNVTYTWFEDTLLPPVFFGELYLTDPLNTTTQFFVNVENQFGCVSSFRPVFAEVRQPGTPDPGQTEFVCFEGNEIELLGQSPAGGFFSGVNVREEDNRFFFNPQGLSSGNVSLTYSVDVNGCPTSDNRTIVIREPLDVEAGFSSRGCFGSIINLDEVSVVPVGGTWSFADPTLNGVLDGSLVDASILPANETGYIAVYTATDANGCTNTDTRTIIVNPLPDVPDVLPQVECGSAFADLTVNNFNGNQTYTWFDDEFRNNILQQSSFQRYNSPERLDSSASFFVVTETTAGCESELLEVAVTINPLPELETENAFICLNIETYNLLDNVSIPNGQFFDGTSRFITETIFPRILGEGAFLFEYEVTNTFGCSTRRPFQIEVVASLSGNLLPGDTSFCESSDPLFLPNFTSLTNGTFSGPGVENNVLVFDDVNDPDGVFTISYEEDDNGCLFRDELNITLLSSPNNPEIQGNVSGCLGETLEFFADEGSDLNYIWRINEENANFSEDQNVNVIVGEVQVLSLEVINAIGCPSDDRAIVNLIDNSPFGTVSVDDSTLTSGDLATFTFTGTENTNISWSFSDGGGDFDEIARHYFYSDSLVYHSATIDLSREGCNSTIVLDSIVLVTPIELPIIANAFEDNFSGNSAEATLFIYPVPTSDFVEVDYINGSLSGVLASVYNSSGVLVIEKDLTNTHQLELNNLPIGIYTLKLVGNNLNHTTQIIKK